MPATEKTISGSIGLFLVERLSERGYTGIERVREYLKSNDIDLVTSDEEIQRIIYDATSHIEEDIRRILALTTVTAERYDDPGTGKLVLKNWPIINVMAVRFYDQSNHLIKEWKWTDGDWVQKVIIDKDNGFLEFPILKLPFVTSTELFRWTAGAGIQPSEWPRQPEFKRMTSVISWIEVDYTYGFPTIPRLAEEAALKLTVIELLGKKGAGETQGTSSMSIAGFGETWAQGGQFTGPYASLLGQLSKDVERNLRLLRRRRAIAVSIM